MKSSSGKKSLWPALVHSTQVWHESCNHAADSGHQLTIFGNLSNEAEFQVFLCNIKLPVGHCVSLTVFTLFTFFYQQVSTGHIITPSSLLWMRREFLLMTAVGLLRSGSEPALSTFQWWTRTAICLNKLIPAVRLNLWKMHHCDNFRHVCLFKWIFRDVPSCNLCYLSQNKNRIKLTYVSTPLKDGIQFMCERFLFRRVTLSSAETCQRMNSRVIQALNVLQMSPS